MQVSESVILVGGSSPSGPTNNENSGAISRSCNKDSPIVSWNQQAAVSVRPDHAGNQSSDLSDRT